VHEAEIVEALGKQRNLENIRGLLTDGALAFCDECEAMKCYGSLYPICEPVLEKLLKAIEEGH